MKEVKFLIQTHSKSKSAKKGTSLVVTYHPLRKFLRLTLKT